MKIKRIKKYSSWVKEKKENVFSAERMVERRHKYMSGLKKKKKKKKRRERKAFFITFCAITHLFYWTDKTCENNMQNYCVNIL